MAGWGQVPAAVDNEWDLRKLLESLTTEARRVKPILDQADPKNWRDASAAQSYASQWKSAQDQIRYLATTTDTFAKQPQRLTVSGLNILPAGIHGANACVLCGRNESMATRP